LVASRSLRCQGTFDENNDLHEAGDRTRVLLPKHLERPLG
jgi:hypothetical protein